MKRLFTALLAALLVLAVSGCQKTPEKPEEPTFKVGIILIGDENEGYTAAHIDGLKGAVQALGLKDDQVIWCYNAGDGGDKIYDKAIECVEDGCQLVISNSYGHQGFMAQAAQEHPEVTFVALTGDNGAGSGLNNLSNGFTSVYQSRYVSGVVAGMKLAELEANGELKAENKTEDGKVKIGYVSAFPYAECVSGFTSYLLGVRSVFPEVQMFVTYTNTWSDAGEEGKAAEKLIADGCVIICQHADTTGAPKAVQAAHEAGKTVYCVGYNISMLAAAPDCALTSASNNWVKCYTYLLETAMKGEKLQDWNSGYETDAVRITELGKACAAGTAEKVAEVEAAIKAGTLHVFDVTTFTVNGKQVSENSECVDAFYQLTEPAIKDGYFHESEYRSAPYFNAIIDGVTELN